MAAAGIAWIGLWPGVPPASTFETTRGQGTPIIIDTINDDAYYYKPGVGVTLLGGGGSGSGIQNYQCSCSDLSTELLAQEAAAYYRAITPVTAYKAVGTLLVASISGRVLTEIKVNDVVLCQISIPAGDESAFVVLDSVNIPDNAKVVIDILEAGTDAKGLIISVIGVETP